MEVKTFSLGPLGTNCYVLSTNNEALVIDPGGEANIINDYLKEQNLNLQAILLTHAHFDHIGAVDELRKQYQVEVYMHEFEKNWFADTELNRLLLFLVHNIGINYAPH